MQFDNALNIIIHQCIVLFLSFKPYVLCRRYINLIQPTLSDPRLFTNLFRGSSFYSPCFVVLQLLAVVLN